MYNNDEKKKKSWVPEGMKGVMNKMQSFNKNQDPKANLQFFDPDLLEEIIKKQLIEKNPKLINDKALLEETIRKAFKDRNLVQKPNKIESPPKNNLPLNKKEVFSMDLLDIGQETNDVKLLVNPNPIFESKEIEIESTKEKFFEEKKSEDIKLLEKKAEIQTQKIENKDKAKINEEINIKYSFLQKTCYFKFETIQEISSVLHQKICENIQKPDINIDKTFIIKVLENLEYLRKYQIENRILEEKFQSTVIDYSKMQERLINQENLLKSIEYTYHEKINEIEHSHQEKINTLLIENKNLKNIIEGNERKISLQLENFKEEISQSQETIKKLQNDFESEKIKTENYEKDIKILENSILHLHKELENYKKIKLNQKLECYYKSQDLISQGNVALKLDNFIPTNIIYKIMEFLTHHDIIIFRSLNKLSYNCMSFDYRFYSLLLKKIRLQQRTEIISLHKKLDYFRNLADKIPDEYLKASLIKFISINEKFGDYVPPILHKSKKVFDSLEEQNEQIISKTSNNQNTSEEDSKKKLSTSSFGGGLFKKMMGLNKSTIISEEKPKFEKVNVEDINLFIGKLFPVSNISVDLEFLKNIESDRSQIIKQAYETTEDLIKRLMNKGVQLSNNMQKIGLFIESLQKNFSFLFVFCSVLLQEGKEIENLKNFLMSHILQINNENRNLKNQNDDINELLISQKKMKEFLALKNKELEKRLHEYDSQILKSKEEISILSTSLKKSTDLCQSLIKEKNEYENKIKLLSKEVRYSRSKVNEYETDMKKIVDNCLDIKYLFENLRIDI